MDITSEHQHQLLVSRRDAAARLQISVRSVDYLIASRQLPARRIGRRRLIPRNALDQFARRDHPQLTLTDGPK
jgi:excisionase family DNA binding protein